MGETPPRTRSASATSPSRALGSSTSPTSPSEHAYHELPEDQRICPTTGRTLVPVGEKLEDEVEYQPGRLKRIVHHHTVYGLSEEDAEGFSVKPLTAPGPPRPIEGSVVGPMLLAWILVQKYVHHLPLYRQQSILGREGLALSRKTTCDWVMAAATALQPIQQALRRLILDTGVVQIDDTPVRCQGPKGHGNFQAHLWTVTSPVAEGIVYDFTEGRGRQHILEVLEDYEEGWLVGDGYSGHVAVAAERPSLMLAGCWAHAIRKFKDAMTEAPVLAVEIVTTIAKLFDLEEELREITPNERLARRRETAPQLIEGLDGLVDGWKGQYSESGKMSDACRYFENQREPLLRFLEDGRVPIHNNACEVAIRPIAVGRKNWLFAGSARGGQAAGTVYTLVESCKLAGVNPLEYLADVLVRVATHPASPGRRAHAGALEAARALSVRLHEQGGRGLSTRTRLGAVGRLRCTSGPVRHGARLDLGHHPRAAELSACSASGPRSPAGAEQGQEPSLSAEPRSD